MPDDPPAEHEDGTEPRRRTRIQTKNEALIVAAALEVFSARGFAGATVDAIAAGAGMSKANVLYYFRRKQDIYDAVLARTLVVWLDPLARLDPNGEPRAELLRYATAKLRLARTAPQASRLFASEMLQGAPRLQGYLSTELHAAVTRACTLLQAWIDEERLAPVDPRALLFLIWSTTQHYADFAPQVRALQPDEDAAHAAARALLERLIGVGLAPDPA